MSRNYFTFENPPKSGKVKKLWDWFIREFGVDQQRGSFSIAINHPGFWQRAQGTPDYCITWCASDYVCNANEIEDIIKKSASDYENTVQFRCNITGVYYL